MTIGCVNVRTGTGTAVMSAIGSVHHADSFSRATDGSSVPFTNGEGCWSWLSWEDQELKY